MDRIDQYFVFRPDPKPEKKEKEVLTAKDFQKKYGQKKRLTKTPISKKPKSSRSKLIKEADSWFSRRIRLEGVTQVISLSQAIGSCGSCKKQVDIRYADCGHLHSRKHMATRFEPQNCDLQCKQCNMSMGDVKVNTAYTNFFIQKYGKNAMDLISIQTQNFSKIDEFELKFIIAENKTHVDILLEELKINKWW
jgi:5-methylcytosine-specific restriction endonuclease McrA